MVDSDKAGILVQCIGDPDPFWRLIVFKEGSHDPGQSQGAAVERMGRFCFSVNVLESQLHAVGLITLEIGHRAYFEPFFLRGRIDFEIIGECGCKAKIAAA